MTSSVGYLQSAGNEVGCVEALHTYSSTLVALDPTPGIVLEVAVMGNSHGFDVITIPKLSRVPPGRSRKRLRSTSTSILYPIRRQQSRHRPPRVALPGTA